MRISTLILLVSGSILSTLSLKAQTSLTASSPMTYIAGSSSAMLHSKVRVINTGTSNVMAKVSRTLVSLSSGHEEYFCWGITCYLPGTPESTHSQTIQPSTEDTSFIGYIDPHNMTGTDVVNYMFFDVNDATDTVSITFTYDFSVGIHDLSSKISLTNAYPNPADGLTSLAYNMSSAKDAKIILYNVLGSAVKEIKLTDKQSTLILSTSDLKSGVYFYSLIADGKSVASRKLVVAHR